MLAYTLSYDQMEYKAENIGLQNMMNIYGHKCYENAK